MSNVIDYVGYEKKLFNEELLLDERKISQMGIDKLKLYWEEAFAKKPIYHGTNSLAFEEMKKSGQINPNERFWGEEFWEFLELLKKAGGEIPYTYNDKGQTHVTSRLKIAKSYAIRSPEIWSNFVGERSWYDNNFQRAYETFKSEISHGYFASHNFLIVDANNILKNSASAPDLARYSLLSSQEIFRAEALFKKFWEYFKKSEPIVMVFSPQAINDESFEIYKNFDMFKTKVLDKDKFLAGPFIRAYLSFTGISVDTPISLDHLVTSFTVRRKDHTLV